MLPPMPTSFHLERADTMARRSVSQDPDGFLPEQFGDYPDPTGMFLVRGPTKLASLAESARDLVRRPAALPKGEEAACL
jgi:hypothetical protein